MKHLPSWYRAALFRKNVDVENNRQRKQREFWKALEDLNTSHFEDPIILEVLRDMNLK